MDGNTRVSPPATAARMVTAQPITARYRDAVREGATGDAASIRARSIVTLMTVSMDR
jgi:hypothetical protein